MLFEFQILITLGLVLTGISIILLSMQNRSLLKKIDDLNAKLDFGVTSNKYRKKITVLDYRRALHLVRNGMSTEEISKRLSVPEAEIKAIEKSYKIS